MNATTQPHLDSPPEELPSLGISAVYIIQADHVAPQPWRNGGGQTRELLVWPSPAMEETHGGSPSLSGSLGGNALCSVSPARCAGSSFTYAEHIATQTPNATYPKPEWKLRISRADIGASGPFSAFEGVQRWFVVLSGKGVVLHMPTPDGHTQDHTLLPGHTPLLFDGGLAPGCTLIDGPTQDLNLMVRGGTACVQPVQRGLEWDGDHSMRGLYVACSGTWTDGQQTLVLAAHTLLWLSEAGESTDPRTPMRFTNDTTSPPAAWWLGYTPEVTT